MRPTLLQTNTADMHINGESLVLNPKLKATSICCLGGGYVGGPTGAVIANRCPHLSVTIADIDERRIAAWKSSQLPVYEPALYDLVVSARDGVPGVRSPNLFFSSDVDQSIREADLIFVGVNTPTKKSGLGSGKASDLGWLEDATRRIAHCAIKDTIVVEKSTVPCGTAAGMLEILEANGREDVHFEVLANPEFLSEGTAVQDLLNPDRILIGCQNTSTGRFAAKVLEDVYSSWVPHERVITMDVRSCELAKVAANALLAQRISSINAISAMCEKLGASIEEISHACGLDSRIGPKMLKASVGFGGSCFQKDIMNLTYMAESLNLPEVALYWNSVVSINEWQKDRFIRRIVHNMNRNLARKRIALLGFAYKKNTGDTRESPAIAIAKSLIAEGADLAIFDPKVQKTQIRQDLGIDSTGSRQVFICDDPYDACNGSHAVLLLTEWDMFSNKDLQEEDKFLRYEAVQQVIKNESEIQEDVFINENEIASDSETTTSSKSQNSMCEGHSDTSVENLTECKTNTTQEKFPKVEPLGLRSWRLSGTVHQVKTKRLDWSRVQTLMKRPMYVFDGRGLVDSEKLKALGFQVEAVGMPSTSV